jgi:integrase
MSGKQVRDRQGRFGARDPVGTEVKRAPGIRGAIRRPQIRAKHKRALTRKEIELFLSTLAETCNVSLSARSTKRDAQLYYYLKRRDAGFRAAWMEALREGYDRLDLELVHRARFGTSRDVFFQGRKTGTTRVFNDGMALRLLHLHRKTVEGMRAADRPGPRDSKALFDELAARIAEMESEEAEEAKGGGNGED